MRLIQVQCLICTFIPIILTAHKIADLLSSFFDQFRFLAKLLHPFTQIFCIAFMKHAAKRAHHFRTFRYIRTQTIISVTV